MTRSENRCVSLFDLALFLLMERVDVLKRVKVRVQAPICQPPHKCYMANAKHLERSANNPNPDMLPVWSRITPFRFVYTKESGSQRGIFVATDDTVPRKSCFGRLRRGLPCEILGLRCDRVYAWLARGLHSSVLCDDVFYPSFFYWCSLGHSGSPGSRSPLSLLCKRHFWLSIDAIFIVHSLIYNDSQ